MEYALKEWDAQVQAVQQGSVSLVLRKGGIIEKKDTFEVEHRKFYLYPTFLHQNAAELRPEYQSNLREQPRFGQVELSSYAEVLEVWKIDTLEHALALEPWQALNTTSIENRFHYRNRPWIHAVLLKTYQLPAVYVPETEAFLGCISWVPLTTQDQTALHSAFVQRKAVHTDAYLNQIRQDIGRILQP